MWHKFESTSNKKQFSQETKKEQLRGIFSKLNYVSGYISATRGDINNNFEDIQASFTQQQNYLYAMKNRSDLYCCIIVILFFFSFGQQQLGEIPSFIPLFSDQIFGAFIINIIY